ncbi:nickel-responsive transcriptional regulator NikR [Candidatus Micrarchaeota archaeon]|nr:nickel-responsive transcriptional regulator NikR [Candidatus Micrarchaeota archaeon]MBU2475834.1 nickel-responsive transcriptional regulator NikR [Candidatus Micrarchaeota archaeon]
MAVVNNHKRMKKKDEVERISISVNKKLLKEFNELIRKKAYISRSKAVSDAIRNYVSEFSWKQTEAGHGIITIIYDHTIKGTTEKIVEAQHSFHDYINSNTHIHLDKDNCLEVLIVKAESKKINEIASKLQSLRGVKQTKLTTISP